MSWLDSTACAAAAYISVAALALGIGCVEVSRARSERSSTLWPRLWFGTAALLLVMAAGRGADTGQLIADLGRREARHEGWYETRRVLQAAAFGIGSAILLGSILIATWRVRARRRRYLPMAVALFAIVCYALSRVISLHQVDELFRNHNVGGVSLGAITELSLLAVAAIVAASRLRLPPSSSVEAPNDLLAAPPLSQRR